MYSTLLLYQQHLWLTFKMFLGPVPFIVRGQGLIVLKSIHLCWTVWLTFDLSCSRCFPAAVGSILSRAWLQLVNTQYDKWTNGPISEQLVSHKQSLDQRNIFVVPDRSIFSSWLVCITSPLSATTESRAAPSSTLNWCNLPVPCATTGLCHHFHGWKVKNEDWSDFNLLITALSEIQFKRSVSACTHRKQEGEDWEVKPLHYIILLEETWKQKHAWKHVHDGHFFCKQSCAPYNLFLSQQDVTS